MHANCGLHCFSTTCPRSSQFLGYRSLHASMRFADLVLSRLHAHHAFVPDALHCSATSRCNQKEKKRSVAYRVPKEMTGGCASLGIYTCAVVHA